MKLRDRALAAYAKRQQHLQDSIIEGTKKRLREEFGVKEEEMDVCELPTVTMAGSLKALRVEELLFTVDECNRLFVRFRLAHKRASDPWQQVESLEELGEFLAQQ